jgi:hypothetical protein
MPDSSQPLFARKHHSFLYPGINYPQQFFDIDLWNNSLCTQNRAGLFIHLRLSNKIGLSPADRIELIPLIPGNDPQIEFIALAFYREMQFGGIDGQLSR